MGNLAIKLKTKIDANSDWEFVGFEFDKPPVILPAPTVKVSAPPVLYSDAEIAEMGETTIKTIRHMNEHIVSDLDLYKKDPTYPHEKLRIADQGDYSRSLDLWYKRCSHYSNVSNKNTEIFMKAVSGSDMKEYGRLVERKSRSFCKEDSKVKKGNNGRLIVEAPNIQGNSSSTKVENTALVQIINDSEGVITHIWECRILIPKEEWEGSAALNTRQTSFQLEEKHFTDPKYGFQQVIGGVELYVTKKVGGYYKYPRLVYLPI